MDDNVSSLMGPKILLEGPPGTGKTYALGTLVDWAQAHNKEVFILFTENGLETLNGYWTDRGLPIPPCLHYHKVVTPALTLEALIDAATKTGQLSYEALTKSIDPNRSKNNPWVAVLQALANFPDDRTGQKFGNIGTWGTDRILVNDSLSESANACFRMQIGNKTTASPADYQVAQGNLIGWIRYLTQSLRCTFVLTAHVQRQVNELTGTTQLMTKAIGKALGDEFPGLFSDVIFTVREGSSWYWDTVAHNVDLKTRNLPYAAKQKPDFALIMDKWTSRGGR